MYRALQVKPSTKTRQKIEKANKLLLWHWTSIPNSLHGLTVDENMNLYMCVINYHGDYALYKNEIKQTSWHVSTLEEL
jgi:hypothetical protein